MSCLLDLVSGASLLPHVYCKKITVENNAQDASKADITLLLEIYQNKNKLAESSWLNNLSNNGKNLLDAMYIQVVPTTNKKNCNKLLPANEPLNYFGGSPPGNIYVAKNSYADNYLPRGPISSWEKTPDINDPTRGTRVFETRLLSPDSEFPTALNYNDIPAPIQIKSSLLGDTTDLSKVLILDEEGVVPPWWNPNLLPREEILDGEAYYVVPFEYKFTDFNPKSDEDDLGFLFYSFLHTPSWMETLEDTDIDDYVDFFEDFILEGPVNTEVVFLDGTIQEKRQAFFLPDGRSWEGSVHFHSSANPDPSGYFGDGALSSLDPAAPYRGWMAGDRHISADQPKLRLAEVFNNKISDFRHGLFVEPPDDNLTFGQKTSTYEYDESIKKIDMFLSPFQKEKKKYFIKDNDAEFSRLYVCRDKTNSARGMFYIDMHELLLRNSSLYPVLFGRDQFGHLVNTSPSVLGQTLNQMDIFSVLERSKILQLRVYRDRVKKHVINTRYEKHANDTTYEEPSKLVGVISDVQEYQTPSQNTFLAEVTGIDGPKAKVEVVAGAKMTIAEMDTGRFFMFSDFNVAKEQAGLYRYRLEVEFKDGTYEFLYDLHRELAKAKIRLDAYYSLATSTYNHSESDFVIKTDWQVLAEGLHEGTKVNFRHYFKNGAFDDAFYEEVSNETKHPEIYSSGKAIWTYILELLNTTQRVLEIWPVIPGLINSPGQKFDLLHQKYLNMLNPVDGSPKGIDYFIRLTLVAMNKLESLLGSTKVNKTGSEIDENSVPNGYTFNNMLDIVVSPGDFTIKEEHTFDHPSELFRGAANENIYIDYLSVGTPLLTSFEGLRSLTPEYFKERCQLEAAKLSPIAQTENGFRGVSEGSNIGFAIGGSLSPIEGGAAYLDPDSFSNTGFSYLAPSVVEISDPHKREKTWNFYYSAFRPNAKNYLNNPGENPTSTLHSPYFLSFDNYDKLFFTLLNYNFKKEEVPNADLTDLYIPLINPAENSREPFKRTLEELGMTVHLAEDYDSFFNKRPGAFPEISASLDYPWPPEYFSDRTVNPAAFFRDFIFSQQQKLLSAKSSTLDSRPYGPLANSQPWNSSLPNSFKIAHIQTNHKYWLSEDTLHDSLESFWNTNTNKNTTFFFFQLNLISKVEYFTGTSGNAKFDENSWSLLKEENLNSLLGKDRKLFCRLSFFDENLKKTIEAPVLDKYFLLYVGANNQIAPIVPDAPVGTPTGRTYQTLVPERLEDEDTLRTSPFPKAYEFWHQQNNQRLREFRTMTEKGRMLADAPRAMPPYRDIYGPDPADRAQGPASRGSGAPSRQEQASTTAIPSTGTENIVNDAIAANKTNQTATTQVQDSAQNLQTSKLAEPMPSGGTTGGTGGGPSY